MRYICSSKDHGYRDSTNPLRGLNMTRLVGLQESGERGDYADLQWFYYYMERSDAMIHSVIQRRRRSFSGAFRERCGSSLRLLFQSGLFWCEHLILNVKKPPNRFRRFLKAPVSGRLISEP